MRRAEANRATRAAGRARSARSRVVSRLLIVVLSVGGLYLLAACQPIPGTIRGTVTDASGTPLGGVVVNLTTDAGPDVVLTTTSAADGTYGFTDIPPQRYRLQATDTANGYTDYWWAGASGWSTAANITFFGAAPVVIDPVMITPATAAGLDGTVTNDSGAPLPGITATAYHAAAGVEMATTTTDAFGHYSFTNLVPGTENPATPGPGPPADGVVRVATYNTLFSYLTSVDSLNTRLPLVVDAIADSGADIVGLQEQERLAPTGLTPQRIATELAARTGQPWHWCWFLSNPHWPGEADTNLGGGGPASDIAAAHEGASHGLTSWQQGDAIVSRLPLQNPSALRLPPPVPDEYALCTTDACRTNAQWESRELLSADVSTDAGPMRVFVSHLISGGTSATPTSRLRQMNAVVARIDEVTAGNPSPVVFLCDCNTDPGTPVHQAAIAGGLADAWPTVHPGDPGYSAGQDLHAPGPTPTRRLDFVFTRGTGPVCAAALVGNTPTTVSGQTWWPSDHFGVSADVGAPGVSCS